MHPTEKSMFSEILRTKCNSGGYNVGRYTESSILLLQYHFFHETTSERKFFTSLEFVPRVKV